MRDTKALKIVFVIVVVVSAVVTDVAECLVSIRETPVSAIRSDANTPDRFLTYFSEELYPRVSLWDSEHVGP